jgi:hypothetical protein
MKLSKTKAVQGWNHELGLTRYDHFPPEYFYPTESEAINVGASAGRLLCTLAKSIKAAELAWIF